MFGSYREAQLLNLRKEMVVAGFITGTGGLSESTNFSVKTLRAKDAKGSTLQGWIILF